MYKYVCDIYICHARPQHTYKSAHIFIYIYIDVYVYICVLHMYLSNASIAHIQPIADRVTQNLEIIPRN